MNHSEFRFAGIYKFTNKVNGKIYVGQAQDIYRRHYTHLWGAKKRTTLFTKALNRYGTERFDFDVLERVDDVSKLNDREQYWMDFFQSYDPSKGYNICKIAGSTRGRKRPDVELINSHAACKIYWSERGGSPMAGKKHSEETKQRISIARQQPLSASQLAVVRSMNSQYAGVNKKAVEQIDITTNTTIRIWSHSEAAAQELGISKYGISAACRGKTWCARTKKFRFKDSHGGFKWQYVV